MASPMPASASQEFLTAFPFLTPDEFSRACRTFCHRFHAWQISNPGIWSSLRFVQHQVVCFLRAAVDFYGRRLEDFKSTKRTSDAMLKISRRIDTIGAHREDAISADPQESQIEEDSEHDPEALVRAPEPNPSLQVDYDIALSPIYQVPILYFMLRWTNHKGPVVGIDSVYQYLVPDQYRKQLENVGIMGGISFDYHPITCAPTFFVHPCNTADAMKHIAGSKDVTPETYLLLWLGLIGHSVGLYMPSEAFATEGSAKPPGRFG